MQRLLVACALGVLATSSFAQAWPAKTIRLIVPFPPGGGTDFVARIVAQGITKATGVAVLVDNKPGAGGNIGLDLVAKSAPDGYTLGLAQTANLAINPYLYPKMSYDVVKDLMPVASVASQPLVLVVATTSPEKTVADVVAAAKTAPGALRSGLAGNGTVGHLAGEMFKRQAGIDITTIPYRGAGPALADLLGGQFEIYFGNAASVLPQITGGVLRPLAVTSSTRLPALKNVPTMSEAGFPGFEAVTWSGIVAPAGTSVAIVDRINGTVQRMLKEPDVQARMAAEGSTPTGGSPADFGQVIRAENQKWSKVIRDAHIKLD